MQASKNTLAAGNAIAGGTMKAIVQDDYGSADVLRLAEIDRPVPQDNQVLVRVHASSVNAGDWHLMRGTPFLIRLMFGGISKPKLKTLGSDVAGRVEAVGKDVTQFQVGAEVFGDVSECGFGAFAEYVCVPETALMLNPDNISFETTAAIPAAALAALQAVRDCGQLQPGQRVLVHGASGGVGSFAVQIAKEFGAEVTGVCSTAKVDMVRSLNADHIIDYTQTDCTQTGPYDLIIDAAAYRSVYDFLPALKPEGTYVMVGGSTARFFQVMFLAPWIARTRHYTVKCLAAKPNQADLATIRDLVTAGKITPFIDRHYSLNDVPDAIRYVEQRQVKGKVVITLSSPAAAAEGV